MIHLNPTCHFEALPDNEMLAAFEAQQTPVSPIATPTPAPIPAISEHDLITAVLAPTIPANLPEQIIAYLATTQEEVYIARYRPRALYLLGFSYERLGQETNAITTYINLINQYPNSAWSQLAWTKLQYSSSTAPP